MLNALNQLNIELTSKCFKHTMCKFCGHQDSDINPNLAFGDMEFDLLCDISNQLNNGIIVSFHRDGEPTDYPRLGDALKLFGGYITSIVTHGENLVKKAKEIIGNCTTVTVSVFRGDPDHDMQLDILKEFLQIKGDHRPVVQIKVVGDMDTVCYEKLGVRFIRRGIHIPSGNSRYAKDSPMVPEVGVCLDFLGKPTVDWKGRLFICNRLDTTDGGELGDLNDSTLDDLWNGSKRMEWLEAHKRGRRDLAAPLCRTCTYWGVPSG